MSWWFRRLSDDVDQAARHHDHLFRRGPGEELLHLRIGQRRGLKRVGIGVGGHVVFVNSGAGINASPGLASYTASKFALRGFANSLRNDEPSLRVTSVHPGRIATEMQQRLVAYEGREYTPAQFLSPETVAKVIADAVNAPRDAHIHEVIVRHR